VYGHESASASTVDKLDLACDFREERVIVAATDVQTGLEWCPTLPNDDGAAADKLAGEALHTKPLCIRIATILGTA
jgi:hypothetical protein